MQTQSVALFSSHTRWMCTMDHCAPFGKHSIFKEIPWYCMCYCRNIMILRCVGLLLHTHYPANAQHCHKISHKCEKGYGNVTFYLGILSWSPCSARKVQSYRWGIHNSDTALNNAVRVCMWESDHYIHLLGTLGETGGHVNCALVFRKLPNI